MTRPLDRIEGRLRELRYHAPRHIIASPLNLIGLQVYRLIYEELRYALRSLGWSPHSPQHCTAIGLYVKDNAINTSLFNGLVQDFDSIIAREKDRKTSPLLVFRDNIATRLSLSLQYLYSPSGLTDQLAWRIWDHLPLQELLNMAEDVYKHKYPGITEISVELESIDVPLDSEDHYDHNTWWHADRHFHCPKAFFFLNSHDKNNGTYEYLPSSNNLTFSRIIYEYLYSCRYFLQSLTSFFANKSFLQQSLLRPRVSNYEYQLLGIKPSPVTQPSNTIVLSDNMGLHRRGKLLPGSSRKQINFNFYRQRDNRLSLQYLSLYILRQLLKLYDRSKRFQGFVLHSMVRLQSGLIVYPSSNSKDRRYNKIVRSASDQSLAEYKAFVAASRHATHILDVGANYGSFTFGCAPLPPGSLAYMFEPNPSLASAICRTISLNQSLTTGINLVQHAVSDLQQELTFYLNESWSGSSSLSMTTSSLPLTPIKVSTIPLDTWARTERLDFNQARLLLKIDVEGYDLQALYSARNILKAVKSYIVIIELSSAAFHLSPSYSVSFLQDIFQSSAKRFIISSNKFAPVFSYTDFMHAIKRSSPNHLDLILASENYPDIDSLFK